jgi:aminopeptidase N
MREGTAPLIRREDYTAPAYWIRTVDLTFDLDPAKTLVINKMQSSATTRCRLRPLRLHGEDLTCCACWSTASRCRSAMKTASW